VIFARVQRLFRGTGAALAIVILASPLLGTLHDATVRHVACPEDGQLIDAPVGAPHAHARAAGKLPTLFAEHEPAADASGENHEHCVIALQAHQRAREQSRGAFVSATPETSLTASGPRDPLQLHSLALYRLAPKASPPLA
jgi:hypothetical protein